jgi:hypothetical protein
MSMTPTYKLGATHTIVLLATEAAVTNLSPNEQKALPMAFWKLPNIETSTPPATPIIDGYIE